MTNEALAIEALRLALDYHAGAGPDEVLVTAERFYRFLSTGVDKTLQERLADALGGAGVK